MLVFLAGAIGTVIGVVLGAAAALRKDGWLDHLSSVTALAVTSLPEFVIAITLVIVFATNVWHLLPAVSSCRQAVTRGASRGCSSCRSRRW